MNINRNSGLTDTSTSQLNPHKHPADLDEVAARTKRVLTPVTPTPEFRARLRDGLQMAAYHREMHELLVRQRVETPWGLLVGAAALGSAAGLFAILLRARQGARPAEQGAAHE